jgi:hypothetical protein
VGVPGRHDGPKREVAKTGPTGLVTAAGPAAARPPAGGGSGDLAQAIAVLRARIDEEFRIAERIDTKQRQSFAFAAGFFAVAQTVAFGGFAQSGFGQADRAIVAIAAVAAGFFLIVVAHRLNNGEELQPEDDLRPESIVEWANEAEDAADPEYLQARLVSELARVARERTTANKQRARRYDRVAWAARASLIATGVELLVAIALRV